MFALAQDFDPVIVTVDERRGLQHARSSRRIVLRLSGRGMRGGMAAVIHAMSVIIAASHHRTQAAGHWGGSVTGLNSKS